MRLAALAILLIIPHIVSIQLLNITATSITTTSPMSQPSQSEQPSSERSVLSASNHSSHDQSNEGSKSKNTSSISAADNKQKRDKNGKYVLTNHPQMDARVLTLLESNNSAKSIANQEDITYKASKIGARFKQKSKITKVESVQVKHYHASGSDQVFFVVQKVLAVPTSAYDPQNIENTTWPKIYKDSQDTMHATLLDLDCHEPTVTRRRRQDHCFKRKVHVSNGFGAAKKGKNKRSLENACIHSQPKSKIRKLNDGAIEKKHSIDYNFGIDQMRIHRPKPIVESDEEEEEETESTSNKKEIETEEEEEEEEETESTNNKKAIEMDKKQRKETRTPKPTLPKLRQDEGCCIQ
eukprot:137866_1